MTHSPTVDFSGCDWWWPEGLQPVPDQYTDFYCDIELQGDSADAWIALSCGTWGSLWLNGERLSFGPLREVAPWQYYDVIDLKSKLRHGTTATATFPRSRVLEIMNKSEFTAGPAKTKNAKTLKQAS